MWLEIGAGEGNRTLVVSLGSFCSTIELHPQRHTHVDMRLCIYQSFRKKQEMIMQFTGKSLSWGLTKSRLHRNVAPLPR